MVFCHVKLPAFQRPVKSGMALEGAPSGGNSAGGSLSLVGIVNAPALHNPTQLKTLARTDEYAQRYK